MPKLNIQNKTIDLRQQSCPRGYIQSPGPQYHGFLAEKGYMRSSRAAYPNCWILPKYARKIKERIEDYPTRREIQAWRLINDFRRQNGLPALALNVRLSAASRRHSKYMRTSGQKGHVLPGHPDGTYPPERAHKFGYRSRVGENIASFQNGFSPRQAFQGWLNSPPHRLTMLGHQWTVMGVGDAYTDWTTMFGTEKDGTEIAV